MINPDTVAREVANHLRENYLNGVVAGLEHHDVSPAELPVLMGLMMGEGLGDARWPMERWIDALDAWIADKHPVQKALPRIKRGVAQASKAYPNWLSPHELEAWKFARDRAGLRITNIEDQARARVRGLVADTITLRLDKTAARAHLKAELEKAFQGTSRDWDRVAVTELAQAFNEGVVSSSAASGHTLFEVITETDACEKCKDAYDGQAFSLKQILVIMPPVLHPCCRCRARPLPKGTTP